MIQNKIVILIPLLFSSLALADGPPSSGIIAESPEDYEGCQIAPGATKGVVFAKGASMEEVEAELLQKAWWDCGDVVEIIETTEKKKKDGTVYKAKGQAYQCRQVRTATDSNAVEGCEYIKPVEINNSFSSMLGTSNPVTVTDLKKLAWKAGADYMIVISSGGNTGAAEAYYCGDSAKL